MKSNVQKVDYAANIATYLAIVFVYFYASGLSNFINIKIPKLMEYWSPLIKLNIVLSAVLIVFKFYDCAVYRRRLLPLLGLSAAVLLPLLWSWEQSYVDVIYVQNIAFIFMLYALLLISNPNYLRLVVVSLVLISCALCLVDIVFYDGFTNTTGRAAGLYVNPNVAGGVILILGISTIRFIQEKWLLSYVVIITAAIFATLSRSSIVVWVISIFALFVISEVRNYFNIPAMFRASVVFFVSLIILAYAFNSNSAFGVAIFNAFASVAEAKDVYEKSVNELEVIKGGQRGVEGNRSVNKNNSDVRPAIDELAAKNSASHRAVLARESIRVIGQNRIAGKGLDYAFDRSPHNSYLLFGISFGVWGLLLIPLYCMFVIARNGIRYGMPASLALMGISFFSHDVILSNVFVAALTLLLFLPSLSDRVMKDGIEHNFFTTCSRLNQPEKSYCSILLALGVFAIMLVALSVQVKQLEYGGKKINIGYSKIEKHSRNACIAWLDMSSYGGLVALRQAKEVDFVPEDDGDGIIDIEHCKPRTAGYVDKGAGYCSFKDNVVIFPSNGACSSIDAEYRDIFFVGKLTVHPLFYLFVTICCVWMAFILLIVTNSGAGRMCQAGRTKVNS